MKLRRPSGFFFRTLLFLFQPAATICTYVTSEKLQIFLTLVRCLFWFLTRTMNHQFNYPIQLKRVGKQYSFGSFKDIPKEIE